MLGLNVGAFGAQRENNVFLSQRNKRQCSTECLQVFTQIQKNDEEFLWNSEHKRHVQPHNLTDLCILFILNEWLLYFKVSEHQVASRRDLRDRTVTRVDISALNFHRDFVFIQSMRLMWLQFPGATVYVLCTRWVTVRAAFRLLLRVFPGVLLLFTSVWIPHVTGSQILLLQSSLADLIVCMWMTDDCCQTEAIVQHVVQRLT